MNLYLNELSLNPIAANKYEAIERMEVLSKAVSKARLSGFRNVKCDYFTNQIELSKDYSLHSWLNDSEVKREQREFLYGVIIPPYINDDDTDLLEEFLEKDFTYANIENNFPATNCIGLASAYLYDSPAISLLSLPFWSEVKLIIRYLKNEQQSDNVVYNISSVDSFDNADLNAFIERISELKLDESPIDPIAKAVTLSGDHHGKKELKKLSDKLIHCPYVVEIRSTNFGGDNFVRKIVSNGVVEIVLINTDHRYALWIQTTGKNLRETKAIAEILEQQYS